MKWIKFSQRWPTLHQSELNETIVRSPHFEGDRIAIALRWIDDGQWYWHLNKPKSSYATPMCDFDPTTGEWLED
jgi:hypothetical protein